MISAGIGTIAGVDVDGSTMRYTHLNASWGYQLSDNIWAELGAGTNIVTSYPSTDIDTRMTNITGKMKYTFSAPFYSYVMPYVGYQVISVDSPGAGVDNGEDSAEQLERELQLIDDLKKSSIIFGVTVLKRIVPGWFVRVDLGTDILNAGLTLEF